MSDDPFKDRIEKAFKEMEKWGEIAHDFDNQLAGMKEDAANYKQVKADHAMAHSLATEYQTDYEKLSAQRERMMESRERDAHNVGPELDEDVIAPEHEPDLDEIYLEVELGDRNLRSIAEEYQANLGERDRLDEAIGDIERADEEIRPDHMERAEDTLRRMEDKHLAVDAGRNEDEAIRHLGESHMALYEAGKEAQQLTQPVEQPKPEVNLNPEMKIRR